MRRALACARALIPDLSSATISRYWSGYIDMSPDALPIIDAASCPDGMVIAAGMSGHGLVLGPIFGSIPSELALNGRTKHSIAGFRLARFREEKVPIPATTI